jgi:methylthioribose-1-phosphate isomerase
VKVSGQHFRTIWLKPDDETVVQVIDQRFLPHRFVIEELRSVREMATAIRDMHVRGAGLIGATAGYGMYLAAVEAAASGDFDQHLNSAAAQLKATRPTAVNLSWAIERQLTSIGTREKAGEKIDAALHTARFDRGRRCGALSDDRTARVELASADCPKELNQCAHTLQRGLACLC